MNKVVKRLCVLVMLLPFTLVLSLLLSGKQTAASTVHTHVVGFVETQTEDDGKAQINKMVQRVCESEAYQLLSIPTERTQDAQIAAMRSLIAYHVDVIVLSPVVERGFDNVLREAQQAQIPVLLLDKGISDIPEGCNVSLVGFDYYGGAAEIAQQYIAQESADAVLLELYGTVGGSSSLQITKGFREVLRQHTQEKDDRITYSVSEEFMQSRAEQATARFLGTQAGVDVIFSHGDGMTFGAISAIQAQGLAPGSDVRIYAIGSSEQARAYLEEGAISALAYCDNAKLFTSLTDVLSRVLREGEETVQVQLAVPVLVGGGAQ